MFDWITVYTCIRVAYPNEYLPIIDLFNMKNCINNIFGWGVSLLLHIMINTSREFVGLYFRGGGGVTVLLKTGG